MIRGTTHDQDARFCDKTKKMLEKSQWPDKYDTKIDLTKVDLELIKVWIEKRLIKLLGEEDDIVSGTVVSHIDEHIEKGEKLNAKLLHVALSGLLQQKTLTFVSELWDLLDEAQRSSRGIPQCLLQDKKKSEQIHRKKLEELNAKRNKLNNNKFNSSVRRNGREDYDDRRERSPEKKKKQKERSKSRSQRKKRSRSAQRKKHKKSEGKRKDRRSRSKQRGDKREKKERKRRSPSSDSSGVVSSSSSEAN